MLRAANGSFVATTPLGILPDEVSLLVLLVLLNPCGDFPLNTASRHDTVMAASHHEFADSESAAFLYSEGDNKEEGGQPTTRQGFWTRTAYIVPYVFLALGIGLAVYVGITTPKSKHDKIVTNILPSQAIFGKIPTIKSVFQPDSSFDVDPFGPDEIDSPWFKLAPPGKGHIKVADPARWSLTGGYPLTEDDPSTSLAAEEYTIALYHQLHCLAAIKSKMSRLQDWYAGDSDNEYLKFALGEDQVADQHIYHCFDYLRQTLLCHGDTTLEGARQVRTETGHVTTVRGVDGWGVVHACRDPASIYAFAEAHRSRNDTGID